MVSFLSYLEQIDYLDDYVYSRIINISILISIFGPFSHWVFFVYNAWRSPLLLFVFFYIGSIIACFMLLIPMAME